MAAVQREHSNGTTKLYDRIHKATAHDWEEDKRKQNAFWDDGTLSFFWRAHTITVLVIFSCILVYVALFEEQVQDADNTKRGVFAVVLAFLLFGVTQTPDGVFVRPHPAFWRLILCLSIVYELALVFLLFQTVGSARHIITHFDSSLGHPLPEKSYGGNCLIYDENMPDNPFHHLKDKLDGFVPTHFFGWWLKTLILRDWWLCTVLSIMFEVLEYTLEHQLPNFSECWWDHWIMDALVCNGLGIYLGMKTLRYLKMKPYYWRSMWNMPTYKGMLRRVAAQFTPYSWTEFDWKPVSSLRRWLSMLGLIAIFLIAELNTFYLKFALWIPPEHWLCLGRLVFFLFMGAAAMRETFQYLDDPDCKKFGRQSWLIAAIIITEFLIIAKFDMKTISKPLPRPVAAFWLVGLFGLLIYTIWKFYIKRDVKNDIPTPFPFPEKIINNNTADLPVNKNTQHSNINSGVRSRHRNGVKH